MQRTLSELLVFLDLEELDADRYRGASLYETSARAFGGQVIAQALVAATRTVEHGRSVHSLHGYFLRPGDTSMPILFEVERLRDGRSFTTRRVTARQKGEAIFALSSSFQVEETGFSHQAPMPQVPPPEDLVLPPTVEEKIQRGLPAVVAEWFGNDRAVEVRPVLSEVHAKGPNGFPVQCFWARANGTMGEDATKHQAVVAYVSDLGLLPTAGLGHGLGRGPAAAQWASLDHAIWFHRPFRADDWLLYMQESPSASNGRGYSRGFVFTRDGVHAASLAQEGLMRPLREKPAK